MLVSREDLNWAASQGLISTEQAEALWKALDSRTSSPDRAQFDFIHVLYYFGALIVIGAMGWFMTLAWENYGGGGIFLIAVAYAIGFILAGRTLWFKEGLKIPGGLLFTMAVCMAPLAIYGLERMLGVWPQGEPGAYRDFHVWVRGSWLLMEVGTVIAGLTALKFVRFPFLTAPIAFALWYMSMDVTPILLGQREFTWDQRLWVSVWFGMMVLLVTYLVDRRTKDDYAFWGYLFGTMAFWGGLSLIESGSEFRKFLYCLINIGLMMASVALDRRVFIVFGSLGVFAYLGHLAWTVFRDSFMFPFVLSLLGIVIIYLGVSYQRKRDLIETTLLAALPRSIRQLLPRERVAR
jgi:hypothetical protein